MSYLTIDTTIKETFSNGKKPEEYTKSMLQQKYADCIFQKDEMFKTQPGFVQPICRCMPGCKCLENRLKSQNTN